MRVESSIDADTTIWESIVNYRGGSKQKRPYKCIYDPRV